MAQLLTKKIRPFVPPLLWKVLKTLLKGKSRLSFQGNYSSWKDALSLTSGYDSPDILERVRNSALKVKHGTAMFERDSVCFYQADFRWPAITFLLKIAAQNQGKLRVLDFGGSLGSFFFQHHAFFSDLYEIHWVVVEQSQFVACGRTEFQNDELMFCETIDECMASYDVDVIFCSGVLQYMEQPYTILEHFASCGTPYLLIDRTPFLDLKHDRLTVQHVPDSIYRASYPAWFFSRSKFEKKTNQIGWNLVTDFSCEDNVGIGEFRGMLFEKNKE